MANSFRGWRGWLLLLIGAQFLAGIKTNASDHLMIEVAGSTNSILTDQAVVDTTEQIQMRTDFPQGQIFYTVDGTAPSFASTRYSNPLAVSSNFVLRAIAYNGDFSQSEARQIQFTVLPAYQLSVTDDPGGLVHIAPAQSSYLSNSVVTLNAEDGNGWFFQRWAGGVSSTNRQVQLVITSNTTVTAVFETTVNTVSTPGGHIELKPKTAPLHQPISLTAVPDPGYYFAAWGGDLPPGNANPIFFPLTSPTQTVSAAFAPLASNQVSLAVLVDGIGNPTVTPSKNVFTNGETATIQVSPPVGDFGLLQIETVRFSGWSGGVSGFDNPVTVLLNTSKVVRASFDPVPEDVLSISEADAGNNLPAIGADGTVYVTDGSQLYSLSRTLQTNWALPTGLTDQTIPSIGPSGTIYVGSANGNLIAVNPDGSIRWRFASGDSGTGSQTSPGSFPFPVHSPPLAIAADETIYSGARLSGTVYVVRNGESTNTIAPLPTAPFTPRTPVIGPDGTLYLTTTNGFAAEEPNQTIKWTAPYPRPAAIDANGRLYSLSSNLVALDFNGNLLWSVPMPAGTARPVIAEDGKVLAQTSVGAVAIATNGQILWTNAFRAEIAPQGGGGAVALGTDNPPVYSGDYTQRPIYELSSHGETNAAWLLKVENEQIIVDPRFQRRAIGPVILSPLGDLYLAETYPSSSARLRHITVTKPIAFSSWPLPWGNPRNDGRAELPSPPPPQIAITRDIDSAILQPRNIPAGAVLEESNDLKTWSDVRPVSNFETITIHADEQQSFFRLRAQSERGERK